MRKRIAGLISNILNPFLVSLIVVLLLSFEATPDIFDALKWALILVAVTLLPVFLITTYLVRKKRLDSLFINVRKQRTNIYLLAGAGAVVGNVILISFGAPLLLVAAFVAGLSAIVIFMGVNLLWKISLHTAFIAASVTLLVILHGFIATVAAVLLPLIAWARMELGYHSPAQVTAGAFLAASIVVMVFYLFGLVQVG